MELQTRISLTKAEKQIDYKSQMLLFGSCFSENIGQKLDYFKFQSVQNPFGILFHPKAIENLISRAIEQEMFSEEDVFFLNERWHCFDAHSDLSVTSKKVLLEELNQALQKTNRQITESSHIIITLGTAWVYRNNSTKAIVANCHKVPQKEFSKELLSVGEIVQILKNLAGSIQSVNKNVRFIFTVSPVRHFKDGFVENQRSKAHLFSALHEIIEGGGASYFPSYEIMMDELRDYRFYEADMVHPNQLAVDYIWEKFKEVWISERAHQVMDAVDTIQKGLEHRPFNPDSEGYKRFQKSLRQKIAYITKDFPFMEFGK